MVYLFIASIVLVFGILIMGHHELTRGVRIGGRARRVIERHAVRMFTMVGNALRKFVYFVRDDIFLKILHGMSYVALLCVRFAERKLAALTHLFHTFRNK